MLKYIALSQKNSSVRTVTITWIKFHQIKPKIMYMSFYLKSVSIFFSFHVKCNKLTFYRKTIVSLTKKIGRNILF